MRLLDQETVVSDQDKRIAVRKCNENDKDSLRWCVSKPDKRKSRVIKGKFSQGIYQLMNWMDGCRYKVLGHKISYKGETLYVFELEECEIFRERPKRTKAEREARAKSMTPEQLAEADRKERRESMTPFSPAEAENTFGLPVSQHQNVLQLESMGEFKGISSMQPNSGGNR